MSDPQLHRGFDGNSDAVLISGKIMVAAIVILFLVVVFVIFLHLYAKWFWLRNADGTLQSRRRRRRFSFASDRDPVLVPHRGLEPSLLRSLPVVIFRSDEYKDPDGIECAVCLCELSDGEKARILPHCEHGFHLECIDMWFQSHSTCPLCRNPVAGFESSDLGGNGDEIRAPEANLVDGSSITTSSESLNFPTNVLFWGGSGSEEGASSSTAVGGSSLPSKSDGMLVIEIPPGSNRFGEEDLKTPTPTSTRLRSLKRLLSREKRVVAPCSPNAGDIEQGGIMQSSKMGSDF